MSEGSAAVSFPVRSPAYLVLYMTHQNREIRRKRYTVAKNLLSLWKGVYTFRLLWLIMTKLPGVAEVWKIKSDKFTCCLFKRKPTIKLCAEGANQKQFSYKNKSFFVKQLMKIFT